MHVGGAVGFHSILLEKDQALQSCQKSAWMCLSLVVLWRSPFLKAEVNLKCETQLPGDAKLLLFIVPDCKCSSCVWAQQIRCWRIQIVLFYFSG